ncbi:MAG: protein O-mannosyl-transferase family [Thermoleophilia bacterium]
MTGAKDNRGWALALFFFTATAASRLPFRDHTLFSWDSGSFALALERFDVGRQRPHPPGYILYVGAGRVFQFFMHNPNDALVALSIFSSALAVAGIYLVARSIFSHAVGMVAAVLLFFSPLFWLYGEIALTYAVEVPLALLVTWLLYQMFFHRRYAIICGAVTPYSIFTQGLDGLRINAKETLKAMLWLAGPSLLPLPAIFYHIYRRDRRVIFLAITTVPTLIFFLVYFIDPPGYLLVCAPAIILLLANEMVSAADWLRELFGRLRFTRVLPGSPGYEFLFITFSANGVRAKAIRWRQPWRRFAASIRTARW